MIRAIAVALAAATFAACTPNPYCLNCAKDDAGTTTKDATIDAPADAFVEADGGVCMPTNGGVEICDGKDNDCDGKVDEGSLDGVGVACGSNVGVCTTGTTSCTAGKIVCSGVQPGPELCDGLDNNCDGTADEGDPGGGTRCGIAEGNCTQGTNHCVGGAVVCVGGQGPVTEQCNGQDDDCDGKIDEDVPTGGACGASNVGTCSAGTLTCVGGGFVCIGSVGPTFETCDHLDNDCDGVVDNGYDTQTDPQNCGDCTLTDGMGNTTVDHRCKAMNDVPGCAGGQCTVGVCNPGFYNFDGDPSNGCETPCTFEGSEVCNGSDDDCDGKVDVNPDGSPLTPPAGLCSQVGACSGAHARCDGADGWVCVYPTAVSTEASTDGTFQVIVPETTCDNIDNDCDGKTDEAYPTLKNPCHDNGLGVCQGTGTITCDTTTTTKCTISSPGAAPGVESCNGLDDDCDGVVDNGAETGNLAGQSWVTLVGGTQIMQYEAARPDATATTTGTDQAFACSQPGVQPWTNVTYPQAVAACTSIGAKLCSETQWQASCEPTIPVVYPLAGPTGTTDHVFVEAENAAANVTQSGVTWTADTIQNYSGVGDLQALPNTGTTVTAANALASAPRLDFSFNLSKTGSYFIWVRMYGATTSDNQVFVGLTKTVAGPPNTHSMTSTANWKWIRSNALTVATTGTWIASVFMGADGVRVDAIELTMDGTDLPPETGDSWAYANNPKLSQPTVCNINSTNDVIQATGAEASCFASGPFALELGTKTRDITTVLQAKVAGTTPSIAIVAGAAAKAGTLSEAGGVATFTLQDGASQVSDFEALLATSTLLRLTTHGTAGNVFVAANDVVAATALTGTSRAYDMTGNVKEWCLARAPGQNPLRGGAADNDEEGATCNLAFSLADDKFFFPNVGFRCCR